MVRIVSDPAGLPAKPLEGACALAVPEAPPTGDLVPNGTGWVIGGGTVGQRMYPRPWSRAHWTLPFLAANLYMGLIGVHHLGHVTSLVLALAPVTLSIGVLRFLVGAKLRRLDTADRPARVAAAPLGAVVRLCGVIVPQATVPTLLRGRPAVLFKSRVDGAEQTQGIDFQLELEDGQRVDICVRGAFLLDRLTWRRHEASVGPGDRVEVCGVLHHEPAEEGVASFDRHATIRHVLRASRTTPLLVRSV
jgi:hypothetical protein